jgi:hypothetical protein
MQMKIKELKDIEVKRRETQGKEREENRFLQKKIKELKDIEVKRRETQEKEREEIKYMHEKIKELEDREAREENIIMRETPKDKRVICDSRRGKWLQLVVKRVQLF